MAISINYSTFAPQIVELSNLNDTMSGKNIISLGALKKLIAWYFSKNALPYWLILVIDMLLLLLAGEFVYWVFIHRVDESIGALKMTQTLFMYTLPSIIGARMFHTYSGIIRYSSFIDLLHVFYANVVSLIVAYALHAFVYLYQIDFVYHMHFRHIVLMYVIGMAAQWGVRALVKTVYDVTNTDIRALKTLVLGVKEGGVGMAKLIRTQQPRRFVVKGFISPDDSYRHNLVMGEKVYSVNDDLVGVIRRYRIKVVLIPSTLVNYFRNNVELQDKLLEGDVKIFMSRSVKELDSESMQEKDNVSLQEVSVEDLLPRDEIVVDMKSMGELLSGKRVLVTGAAGSIGSELVRQVAVYRPEAMMLIDQAETPEHDVRLMMEKKFPDVQVDTVVTSICKQDRMEHIFSQFKPDYVFHAAAYKHVPMMEDNPSEAVQNNIYGTKVIADLSVKYGVKKFVMVSTDKAVNPTNVMGCSKRICEIYVQALGKQPTISTQFVTTRFGNVLGSNGSVIPLFREQIRNGGPVTVTHPDIIRYFMLIPEACKLVLEAGTKGNGGEIFVFDMGKPVRIADLAKRMIKLSGAKGVEVEYTGLREGEKLYEEVLNEKENTKPTFHNKIRIATVRSYDFAEVSKQIDELIELSRKYDNMATVRKMKEIVPEYKSNNSVYEVLDK